MHVGIKLQMHSINIHIVQIDCADINIQLHTITHNLVTAHMYKILCIYVYHILL